jgi:hypothetical protein
MTTAEILQIPPEVIATLTDRGENPLPSSYIRTPQQLASVLRCRAYWGRLSALIHGERQKAESFLAAYWWVIGKEEELAAA